VNHFFDEGRLLLPRFAASLARGELNVTTAAERLLRNRFCRSFSSGLARGSCSNRWRFVTGKANDEVVVC
jgi:hypothetical protein